MLKICAMNTTTGNISIFSYESQMRKGYSLSTPSAVTASQLVTSLDIHVDCQIVKFENGQNTSHSCELNNFIMKLSLGILLSQNVQGKSTIVCSFQAPIVAEKMLIRSWAQECWLSEKGEDVITRTKPREYLLDEAYLTQILELWKS